MIAVAAVPVDVSTKPTTKVTVRKLLAVKPPLARQLPLPVVTASAVLKLPSATALAVTTIKFLALRFRLVAQRLLPPVAQRNLSRKPLRLETRKTVLRLKKRLRSLPVVVEQPHVLPPLLVGFLSRLPWLLVAGPVTRRLRLPPGPVKVVASRMKAQARAILPLSRPIPHRQNQPKRLPSLNKPRPHRLVALCKGRCVVPWRIWRLVVVNPYGNQEAR